MREEPAWPGHWAGVGVWALAKGAGDRAGKGGWNSDIRLGAHRVLVISLLPPGAWPRTGSFSTEPSACNSSAQRLWSEGPTGANGLNRKGTRPLLQSLTMIPQS